MRRAATEERDSTSSSAAAQRALAGAVYVVLSALCFGSMALFARIAAGAGADTSTMLLLRFSVAAAIMWCAFAAKGVAMPRGRSLAVLVAMGAVGYAGQAFCYFTALQLASAGLVALLLYLYPAIVTLLAWLVFRHGLTRLQLLAVFMALAGSLLTVGRAGDGSALGIAFALGGALIYSVYILTGSRLPPDVAPTASAAVVTSSAAVVYALVALARGVHLPATAAGWAAMGAIAVVCTVLAIGFFFAGLERLGPVRASIYSTVEPAFTVFLGAVALGERLTPLRVVGGGLILLAVTLLARGERPR